MKSSLLLTTFGILFSPAIAPLDAATAIYQDDALDPITNDAYDGIEDTFVGNYNSIWENFNFGQRHEFSISGSSGNLKNTLMRFDVTSMAGEYSEITSVTLRLYFSNPLGNTGSISVYPLMEANSGWVEGPGGAITTANVHPGSSTWNEILRGNHGYYDAPNGTGTLWAGGSNGAGVAGVDHEATAIATIALDGTEVAGQAVDLVFTDLSLVEDWISGTNYGIVLKGQTGDFIFHSSEANLVDEGNQIYQPQLIFGYTPIPEVGVGLMLLGALVVMVRRR